MTGTRVALTLALAAAAFAGGCGSPAPAPPPQPAPDAATPAATYFEVPAAQLGQLTIAPAERVSWSADTRTTGTVDWDNDHTTQAITQVSGPIARIVADTGTRVRAGDPLLFVASPDVANATSAYRKARNRLDLAQRALARTQDLVDHKALAPRDLEAAQADFNDASTDLLTAQQALRIFGVSAEDIAEAERQNEPIRAELVMRAPLGGTVVQKMVLPGQFIQAGATAAFVISDTSTVWVQAHVYDKDLAAIRVGDAVDEASASFPGAFHGTVTYIGDSVDPATRTTPVRVLTPNPGHLLKKDLFLDLVIHGKTARDVLAVPTAAVLYDEQNAPFVYVQVSPGRFAQRLVTLGEQRGDRSEVLSGLQPGEPVVAKGSVFLQFAGTIQEAAR